MDLTLPSGTSAYLAAAPSPTRGLVLVPDIMGLRPLFTEMADRLAAEHGWSTVCFELWPGQEDLPVEERLGAVGTLTDERFAADLAAAADAVGVEPVAVLGFCMGGMVALKAAASGRFDKAVSFYGMVRLPEPWQSETMGEPLDALAGASTPILELVGTEDPWISADDADALAAIGAEVVRYEGADHGFVHDPSRPTHRAADAADAWGRVAAFLAP